MTLTDNTRWQAEITATGVEREGLTLERAAIIAGGDLKAKSLTPDPHEPTLSGSLRATLTGLDLEDDGLSAALGDTATLQGNFAVGGEDHLKLETLDLKIADYGLTGDVTVRRKEGGLVVDANAQADVPDLSRFAKLAGQPIDGAAKVTVKGTAEPLAGSFDVTVTGETTDLDVGIPELVKLLEGTAQLNVALARATTGTHLRTFTLQSPSLSADASGSVSSKATDLNITAKLDDLGLVVPAVPGPVSVDGTLKQADGAWQGDLSVTAPNDSTIDVTASVPPQGTAQITARGNIGALPGILPDGLAPIDIDGQATRAAGTQDWAGELNLTAGDDAQAMVKGTMDASGLADVTLSAKAGAGTGLIPEDFAPVALGGRLQRAVNGIWQTDVSVTSADAAQVTLKGNVGENGAADLPLDGALPFLDPTLPPAMPPVGETAEDGANLTRRGSLQRSEGMIPDDIAPLALRAEFDTDPDQTWDVSAHVTGAERITLHAKGNQGPDGLIKGTIDGSVAVVGDILPASMGPVKLNGTLQQTRAGGWTPALSARGPNESGLKVDGALNPDGSAKIDYDGKLTRLERLLEDFRGTITSKGSASLANGTWQIKRNTNGPGGITSDIAGSYVTSSGIAHLTAAGPAPLALANPHAAAAAPAPAPAAAAIDFAGAEHPARDRRRPAPTPRRPRTEALRRDDHDRRRQRRLPRRRATGAGSSGNGDAEQRFGRAGDLGHAGRRRQCHGTRADHAGAALRRQPCYRAERSGAEQFDQRGKLGQWPAFVHRPADGRRASDRYGEFRRNQFRPRRHRRRGGTDADPRHDPCRRKRGRPPDAYPRRPDPDRGGFVGTAGGLRA